MPICDVVSRAVIQLATVTAVTCVSDLCECYAQVVFRVEQGPIPRPSEEYCVSLYTEIMLDVSNILGCLIWCFETG